MKILIVGGVAAGTSAAAKAHRVNPDAEITLIEKDTDISYAGCGLPYYISQLVKKRKRVVINTAERFAEKYDVDVLTEHEVLSINPKNKTLIVKDLNKNKEKKEQYDKLIISTGAKPFVPPIAGIELNNIMPLRTVNDADKIKDIINNKGIKDAVIIGAGLIGLEMAESFDRLGINVSVVEMQEHVLPNISSDMAEKVEEHLESKGVNLILGDGVQKFQGQDEIESVITQSGEKIKADLVLLSLGIRPEVELAKKAGIELGETGAIKVNEKMETSLEDIYSAGDCAESVDILTNKAVWIPLGSTANKQGRIAGENAAGGDYSHRGIMKTGISKIFDYTVATTGLSKKEAEENGFNPIEISFKAANHAGYYPDVSKLYIKGIFDKEDGKILGAEVIGEAGADKRIDVLSTAIYSGLKAKDLFQIDLAYAPPYSSPKDPVAILGILAEKKLK